MHPFDTAIDLQPVEQGRLRGRTHPEWANMVGPFGGITAAVLRHAVEVQPDRLGDPLALTVNFAAPIADGDCDITARAARTSQTNQHWILELSQDGEIKTTATALFGIRRDTWADTEAAMPVVASPETIAPSAFGEIVVWANRYDMWFAEGEVPVQVPAYLGYRSFIAAELRRRTGWPGAELLDRLSAAVSEGEISDEESFFYAVPILVAGNETTTNLLGMLLMRLAQDPGLFDQLRADRSLLPAAVEETARWGSPVQWVARTATADHPIGDTVIPRGARVVLFYASANRDPVKFADPDRFDIHRSTAGHLAFGHGIHFCLGAQLARLEVVTAVDHLLDEVDGLELAGPVRWGTTPSLQGPVSVPVRARRAA